MNRPLSLLRFVQAVFPMTLPLRCVRFRTAPLRALSPVGLFVAMCFSSRVTTLWNAPSSGERGPLAAVESGYAYGADDGLRRNGLGDAYRCRSRASGSGRR